MAFFRLDMDHNVCDSLRFIKVNMMDSRKIVTFFMFLLLASCSDNTFKEDLVFAGGIVATSDDLNAGKMIYTENCMACHGVKGDGKGVAHKGLQVPPRDFTQGIYKFGHVLAGELPHDRDFYKLLEDGLHGTAMLPWDLSEKQMYQVMQYIKTFARDTWEGKDKELGVRIVPTKDPYGLAHKRAAIQRGKEVYHAEAQCQSCHRAYVSYQEFSDLSEEAYGSAVTLEEMDPLMYQVKPQPSDYGVNTLPPDFTWHHIRSGYDVEDIYIRLVAGVGGASMPSWKDVLSDEDIWAVAHYVRHLVDLKDTPERRKLMDEIKASNEEFKNQ